MSDWNEAQRWEAGWHGNCVNSYHEESKQMVYARKMGLQFTGNDKTPYNIDLHRKSVLDIGGGAYSLLLKCTNFSVAMVADPCNYPAWVEDRYESAKIRLLKKTGEDLKTLNGAVMDEVWIYNVLQHTYNPEQIINNAFNLSKIIRIFEWVENGISDGHLQNLKEELLNKWLNGRGKVEYLNEGGCVGLSYYGIFKGRFYNEG